jgi:hypothetical protein
LDASAAAVIILLGLVALRWIVVGVGVALLVRPVRECPACFHETFGLHHPLLRLVKWLEWRWCPQCGWQGPARRDRPVPSAPRSAPGDNGRKPGEHKHFSP